MVEDDATCRFAMSRAVEKRFPDAHLHTAATLTEAQTIKNRNAIDFFILDLHLPDGSGVDLLLDAKSTVPDAHVVIITATPLPEYVEIANSVGVQRFIEKPFLPKDILAIIASHMEIRHIPEGRNRSGTFSCLLTGLTAMDILQLKCLHHTTQGLEFHMKEGRGRIILENGQIVHAETPSCDGMSALQEILLSEGGEVVEVSTVEQFTPTILGDWQGVLLQAVQSADEKAYSEN